MEITEIKSSSDEDDDSYLNSVAQLKALKQQTASEIVEEKKEEQVEEKKQEQIQVVNVAIPKVPMVTQVRAWQTRREKNRIGVRTRRQIQKDTTQDQDSDLEFVSIEMGDKSISAENDLEIIETNVENNDSCEDENYDISIKILWQSKKIHRLNIRQNENFQKIFEYFANLEKVPLNVILITKKDRVIKRSDTPTSINLSVIDILEGGIVKRDSGASQDAEETVDEDVRMIKVQSTNKKSITVPVKRDEDFKALVVKCAQELNTEESKIKLYFDGELVTITDTPDSLDIEDEACFDLRISS